MICICLHDLFSKYMFSLQKLQRNQEKSNLHSIFFRLILGGRRPLITGSEFHTVYIKNSIRFSYFGDKYHRNNLPNGICRYDFTNKTTWLCNIFRLGKHYSSVPLIVIIIFASGNFFSCQEFLKSKYFVCFVFCSVTKLDQSLTQNQSCLQKYFLSLN